MAGESLVPSTDGDANARVQKESNNVKKFKNTTQTTIKSKGSSSSISQNEIDGLHLIRKKYLNEGLSKDITDMIMKGWRDSTKKTI